MTFFFKFMALLAGGLCVIALIAGSGRLAYHGLTTLETNPLIGYPCVIAGLGLLTVECVWCATFSEGMSKNLDA
jgi:hypothetical protein